MSEPTELEILKAHNKQLQLCVKDYHSNLVNIEAIKNKLVSVLYEADEIICELCKRLNPQHRDCTSCEDHDNRINSIKESTQ